MHSRLRAARVVGAGLPHQPAGGHRLRILSYVPLRPWGSTFRATSRHRSLQARTRTQWPHVVADLRARRLSPLAAAAPRQLCRASGCTSRALNDNIFDKQLVKYKPLSSIPVPGGDRQILSASSSNSKYVYIIFGIIFARCCGCPGNPRQQSLPDCRCGEGGGRRGLSTRRATSILTSQGRRGGERQLPGTGLTSCRSRLGTSPQ